MAHIQKTNKKGIIVLDASVLLSLTVRLPHERLLAQQETGVYLFDLLYPLHRAGFEILVPEMVAFEAARVLRTGFLFMSYWALLVTKRPVF